MKKIDLHIHTSPTISDSAFEFSLEEFRRYVVEASLDAVAITNHNFFDREQFAQIAEALTIPVFPGIEVNLEMGHVLVIADPESVVEFSRMCAELTSDVPRPLRDYINIDRLEHIFGDLSAFLVIPHYDKKPAIQGEVLERLRPCIAAGEVDSEKKFVRAIRDPDKFTPVLFSDTRISIAHLKNLPTRQTYVDCGDLTIGAIKECLRDKSKVALSPDDGNELFQLFEDGQMLSTGLNILLGERSSGKTYTLNRIVATYPNTKYIRQFSLVQTDEEAYTRSFNEHIQNKRSSMADGYLSGLKGVLDEVVEIDLAANERSLGEFVESLIKSAQEADRRDAYSSAALFDEENFPIPSGNTLKDLIQSVRQIIENIEFREIIEKHVDLAAVKSLACELIELLWRTDIGGKKEDLR